MSDAAANLSALYQELILEHNRRPRNYRVMEGAGHFAMSENPTAFLDGIRPLLHDTARTTAV